MALKWRPSEGAYTGGKDISIAECGPFYAKTFVSKKDPAGPARWEVDTLAGSSHVPSASGEAESEPLARAAVELHFMDMVNKMKRDLDRNQ